MRRQIRRTAEQSLAQSPIFTEPPATPLYHSAPPEVNVARLGADSLGQPPVSAGARVPEATTVEGSRPPVQVEPALPASASSVETSRGEAGQPASHAPEPSAPAADQDEWQLPQWQYTSKRARANQQQEQRKKRR